MTNQEVLDNLAIAQAQVEWEYSMNIAAALDVAMKRVKDWERLKEKITKYKRGVIASTEVGKGIIMWLSYIEGCMAEMENDHE